MKYQFFVGLHPVLTLDVRQNVSVIYKLSFVELLNIQDAALSLNLYLCRCLCFFVILLAAGGVVWYDGFRQFFSLWYA